MPTPVSVARQCLTDEAARALDDAVSVARRRSHAQTTSLHAVSALLALPSSTLRDACARARNSPCSPRLQFRALELCVGVSLDRLPSSKTVEEQPPISNSLMAAIKRSQANQRRHPDNFHLHQIHCSQQHQQQPSVLKVELKHFILSILDDPIVSRVLGEAGFRSCDIKLAIIHPPVSVTQPSRLFSRSKCPPPIFLCNLTGSDLGRPGFGYPFSGCDSSNENCRRIGEKISKGKSLLLLGVCASDALNEFVECANSGDKGGIFSSEVIGLSAVSIEKEIIEFISEGGSDKGKEKMGLKFDELRSKLEQCLSPGSIVLNFGELKVLLDENVCSSSCSSSSSSVAAASYLVSKLTGMLKDFKEKLRLMGSAARYETYAKFLGKFPFIEKDWDLNLLPITSTKSPIDNFGSKSSLMGSFVPFGGFFPTPSDFKNTLRNISQPVTRCHLCTAKYEQEVSAMLKKQSTTSVADQYSENLPSWLQMAQLDTAKGLDAAKTKNDGTTLNATVIGLQKKWDDICQRLHLAQPLSKFDVSQGRPLVPIPEGFPHVADRKESSSSSCSRDSSLNESQSANLGLAVQMDLHNVFPAKHGIPIPVASEAENVSCQSRLLRQQKEKDGSWFTPSTLPNLSLRSDHTTSSSVSSVTTDLGLGTIYASSSREPNTQKLHDHEGYLQRFSGFKSSEFRVGESTSHQIIHSSSCSSLPTGGHADFGDYKSILKAVTEKVEWQEGAVCAVSQAISHCKTGYGRSGSTGRGDIWLTFLGPDRVGKRRIASALAEIMFGSNEHLISVDLSFSDGVNPSNSVFECQISNDYDVKFRGKTVADYILAELGKRPRSVVFLENIEKADFLVQNSLSQAVRTGKFPNSHGREISINNMIFVVTSTMGNVHYLPHKEPVKFSEETILRAKRWQIKILVEHTAGVSNRSCEMKVKFSGTVASVASPVNKRKLDGSSDTLEQDFSNEANKRAHKMLGSSLDLNLPVEKTDEDSDSGSCDSDSISENSHAWLDDFFNQVGEKILFKPFDFDALAEKIMRVISIQFQKEFGSEITLEIDNEVMVQILAASWLSDRPKAMEDWVEKVLGNGFVAARQKYHVGIHHAVKLVTCKGLIVEERAPGICLPARINL